MEQLQLSTLEKLKFGPFLQLNIYLPTYRAQKPIPAYPK